MLVCIRGIQKETLDQRCAGAAKPSYERYYSLYTNEGSTTIVDATDNRARRTFQCDASMTSLTTLLEQIARPLLMTVLAPGKAAQATIVADGTPANRIETLLHRENGVLPQCTRIALADTAVQAVYLSAVTLDDDNQLRDIFATDPAASDTSLATVAEDVQDQFTSVEDARYVAVDNEAVLQQLLSHSTTHFISTRHQVWSLIFTFRDGAKRPNTTLQFVSFALTEVSRGMKASRHAISAAAALIECRATSVSFMATKLLYLLKPALLGQQPGAWVSCFCPISIVDCPEEQRETFKDAFAMAQTASRLYSSRIALMTAPTLLPPAPAPAAETSVSRSAVAPAVHLVTTPRADESRELTTDGGRSFTSVASPLVGKAPMTATTATVGDEREAEEKEEKEEIRLASQGVFSLRQWQRNPSVTEAREDPVSNYFEYETYRLVMERAMEKLRGEVQKGAARVEESSAALKVERQRCRGLQREMEALQKSYHAATEESALLHSTLDEQQVLLEEKLNELSAVTQRAMELEAMAETSAAEQQLMQAKNADAAQWEREEELQILKVRVKELTDLVAFHQSEIKAHVARETSYRQRILDLENAVRRYEREAISALSASSTAARATCAPRRDAPREAMRSSTHDEEMVGSGVETVDPRHTAQGFSRLTREEDSQREVAEAHNRTTEVEHHLRQTLEQLRQERSRSSDLEALLRKREADAALPPLSQTQVLMDQMNRRYEQDLQSLRAEGAAFRVQENQPPEAPLITSQHSGGRIHDSATLMNSSQSLPSPQHPYGQSILQHSAPSRLLSPAADPQQKSTASQDRIGDASMQSALSARVPSPRLRRSRSFEDFMKEQPQYQLHQPSFMRRGARRPV